MRFFNKISLSKKMYKISSERNIRTFQLKETIHPLYTKVIPYLGCIFMGIVEDVNCSDVLKALADSSEKTISNVTRLLTFWLFWSLDRLVGYKGLLRDPQLKEYFLKIWDLNNDELQKLIKLIDSEKKERKVLVLWELICVELKSKDLFPLHTFKYIRMAQKMVIDPESLERMSKIVNTNK
jgi:hypothetical protein